jgi:ATP phosphoribosyltransferase
MTAITAASPAGAPRLPVVLVAKNRGLSHQVARAAAVVPALGAATRYAVRGEDVPYLSNAFARSGRGVVAVTGDDLVDEWLAAGNKLDPSIRRRRIPWADPAARYGKPALCLIGAPAARPAGEAVRVAICTRYWNLAMRFFARSANEATEFVPIQGALETVCLEGLADFIVDVVVTGETAARAGLVVHEVISLSDVAILETA